MWHQVASVEMGQTYFNKRSEAFHVALFAFNVHYLRPWRRDTARNLYPTCAINEINDPADATLTVWANNVTIYSYFLRN